MHLSAVIVSFNTKNLTLKCIESVLAQGSGLEVETIVVDNGSSDGSAGALKNLKQIKLIQNKSNLGFARGVNQGIKVSSGKHVLLLNSDCELGSGALKKLFDFAESALDAGVIGAKLVNPDGSVQPSCYFFPGLTRALKRYFGERNEVDKYYPKGSSPVQVEAVVFAATLITKSALDNVGILDERYFMFFEDLDYCKRAKSLGLNVYYFPGAQVIHHHGASGRNEADAANQWRRLIPSSKIYHGLVKHHLIVWAMWLGQKWESFSKKPN